MVNYDHAPVGSRLFASGSSGARDLGSGSLGSSGDHDQLLTGLLGARVGNTPDSFTGGYSQTPYFDMASMLASLFNAGLNVNAQAHFKAGN
jgi:hypothetical protein